MSNMPKIGESELYVMKALWESSPLSGNDIVKKVSAETDWSQSTILTMIRRLVKKQAIGCTKDKVMMYYPIVEEDKIIRIETNKFLNRVYKGSVNLMIRGILENNDISKEELDELKRMLNDMDKR